MTLYIVWFAEYLQNAALIPVSELARVKTDCEQLFGRARKMVDSTDSAYRVCPTFENLIRASTL